MKDVIKDNYLLLKNGTIKMFKELFNSKTSKNQIANILTFSRILIPIITLLTSIIGIITMSYPLFIISGAIAGIGGVTDALDGHISRITKSTSQYGKLLDQISDKVFVGIIGINLLFLNFNYIYTLIAEGIISIVNLYYKLKNSNLNIDSTKIGKIKETPLFLSLILGYLSPISSTLMLISNFSVVITLIFQTATIQSYILSNREALKNINKQTNNSIEEEKNYTEKVETLNNSKTLSKSLPRKEQLIRLRDILIEIKNYKEIDEQKTYQKR